MIEFDVVKDSGERQNFDTGSRRDTRTGKGRFDLISPIVDVKLPRELDDRPWIEPPTTR